jgi:protein-S-isoprenylcysteine O-methyltransferase Ste14
LISKYRSDLKEQDKYPTSVPRLVKIVPPIWIVIFVAVGLCVNWLFPSRDFMDWRSYPIGIILFGFGLSGVLWAGSIFHRRGTEIVPASPMNKLLLVEGPFKITRNPMYLGMTLAQLGIAFFVGTLPMFFVPIAFFCLINFVFIPFEEQKMLRQFGDQFADYKRRVRRWL